MTGSPEPVERLPEEWTNTPKAQTLRESELVAHLRTEGRSGLTKHKDSFGYEATHTHSGFPDVEVRSYVGNPRFGGYNYVVRKFNVTNLNRIFEGAQEAVTITPTIYQVRMVSNHGYVRRVLRKGFEEQYLIRERLSSPTVRDIRNNPLVKKEEISSLMEATGRTLDEIRTLVEPAYMAFCADLRKINGKLSGKELKQRDGHLFIEQIVEEQVHFVFAGLVYVT